MSHIINLIWLTLTYSKNILFSCSSLSRSILLYIPQQTVNNVKKPSDFNESESSIQQHCSINWCNPVQIKEHTVSYSFWICAFLPSSMWQDLFFFAPVPFHLFCCGEISHKSQTGSISPWATEPFVRKTKCCYACAIASHCQTISCFQTHTHALAHSLQPAIFHIKHKYSFYFVVSLLLFHSPPGLFHVFLSNASKSICFSGKNSLYFLTAGQIFSTYLNDADVLHLHCALPITRYRSERRCTSPWWCWKGQFFWLFF